MFPFLVRYLNLKSNLVTEEQVKVKKQSTLYY